MGEQKGRGVDGERERGEGEEGKAVEQREESRCLIRLGVDADSKFVSHERQVTLTILRSCHKHFLQLYHFAIPRCEYLIVEGILTLEFIWLKENVIEGEGEEKD